MFRQMWFTENQAKLELYEEKDCEGVVVYLIRISSFAFFVNWNKQFTFHENIKKQFTDMFWLIMVIFS